MFGVGPTLILSVILAVEVFDFPATLAAPVGAALMCMAAYVASRETSTLSVAVAMAIFATMKPLRTFVIAQRGAELPDWLQGVSAALTSDGVIVTASVVGFALAMFLGIFGPLRRLKSVDELLKEHKDRK